MTRRSVAALGLIGGVLAAFAAANVYQRVTTDEIPATVVARLDDVELRRSPSLVRAETVADSETAAFRRLFRYIAGENEGGDAIAMTTPAAGRVSPYSTDRFDLHRAFRRVVHRPLRVSCGPASDRTARTVGRHHACPRHV
jgi:hypothetical protein